MRNLYYCVINGDNVVLAVYGLALRLLAEDHANGLQGENPGVTFRVVKCFRKKRPLVGHTVKDHVSL